MQDITILVVEDNDKIREFIVRTLSGAGYKTIEAATGEKAYSITHADLAILDNRLPDIPGTKIAEHMRALKIPFIFLTADDTTSVMEDATRLGALGYLQKPVNMKQLTAAIKVALTRARDIVRLREKVDISTAIGIIAGALRITTHEADTRLIEKAKKLRRHKVDVAREIINLHNQLMDI